MDMNIDLDVIGRYLVISKNGDKSYVSLRTKKNIDLTNTYVNMTADGNEFDDQAVVIDSDITTVHNGNNLDIIQLNRSLEILLIDELPEPWTLLFSAKLDKTLTIAYFTLTFTDANLRLWPMTMRWSSGTFTYDLPNQNPTSIDVDTAEFNHMAFEYVGNKLTVWVNGKSRKSHNVDLANLSRITMNVNQLGVLSLYNRELSKTEVAEHFVEYQVKNFSNDEVLI